MKRILAVALTIIMLLSIIPAYAVDTAESKKNNEVAIVVPGVIESMLRFADGPNYSRRFFDTAYDYFITGGHLSDLIGGVLQSLFLFRYDKLEAAVEKVSETALGALEMKNDGTPAHNLMTVVSSAEESSMASLLESGNWEHVDFGAMIALELVEQVGAENVFVFCYDWRLSSTVHADRLRGFIDDVKRLTGAEKVNLYGNSFGCQVVAKYLSSYSGEGNVSRAVFNAPAWRGTSLFKGLMAESRNELDFDLEAGAKVVLNFLIMDLDVVPLMKLIPKRIASRVEYTIIKHAMDNYLLHAPGLWCCCAVRDYEEMKEKLLDPERDGAFISIVDEAQYGIMSHIPEMLAQAEADGVSVAVTMNDGTPLFAGKNIDGDGVVDVISASGGETVPFGSQFTDGRYGAYVSPSNNLDLTNAFLPERTWVISSQTHGQTYWDETTRKLVPKLLLTDEIKDVFSDPDFPQFLDSQCPAYDVSIHISGGEDKTLDPSSGKVKAFIKNNTEQHTIIINSVTACGIPYLVLGGIGVLKPGETKTVTLIPSSSAPKTKYGGIKINYTEFEIIPQIKSRTQAFKLSES